MKVFILVHGAWHGAWCWEKLTPLLRAAGHRVLAPGLPGHGPTPADGKVSLAACADAVAALLTQCEGKAIVVGHSMGGMVISAAAQRQAHKVEALVYLAAFLPRPGDSVFSLMAGMRERGGSLPVEALMRLSADKRFYTLDREGAGELFYQDCEREDIEWAVQRLSPQPVLPLSGRLGDSAPDLPCIYVSCLRDKVIPVREQRRMVANVPCRELLQLDAGHSPFLSQPEELAKILQSL